MLLFAASSFSSLFNYTLTNEDCMTFILCSSALDKVECVIQYGLNFSYQDLGPPVSVPLNTSLSLPDITSSTQYYFILNVTVGTTSFQVRDIFTTGKG